MKQSGELKALQGVSDVSSSGQSDTAVSEPKAYIYGSPSGRCPDCNRFHDEKGCAKPFVVRGTFEFTVMVRDPEEAIEAVTAPFDHRLAGAPRMLYPDQTTVEWPDPQPRCHGVPDCTQPYGHPLPHTPLRKEVRTAGTGHV